MNKRSFDSLWAGLMERKKNRDKSDKKPYSKPSTPDSPSSDFYKEVILLNKKDRDSVLSSVEKESFRRKCMLRDLVKFNKTWSEEAVVEKIKSLFLDKLCGAPIQILRPTGKKLFLPLLEKDQPLDGAILFKLFHQKPVYVRPGNNIIEADSDVESSDSDLSFSLDFTSSATMDSVNSSGSINSTSAAARIASSSNFTSFATMDTASSSGSTNLPSAAVSIARSSLNPVNLFHETSLPPCDRPEDSSDDDFDEERERTLIEIHDAHMDHAYFKAETSSQVTLSLEQIFDDLRKNLNENDILRIIVDRNEPFNSFIPYLCERTQSFEGTIKVTFTNLLGVKEAGIDGMEGKTGGLTNEFLRLALKDMSQSRLFCGPDNSKTLIYNSEAEKGNEYFCAGNIIALSFILEGPSPECFSQYFTNCILYGLENTIPSISDVNNEVIHAELLAVQSCKTLAELQDALAVSTALRICGCKTFTRNFDDKEFIIADALKFYLVNAVKSSFAQFEKGLSAFGFLSAVRKNKQLFWPLLLKNDAKLNMESFQAIFQIVRSPEGSNAFKIESDVLYLWMKFLENIENKKGGLRFEDILIFTTGLERPPPLGFRKKPTITFHHLHPLYKVEASTCSRELRLPIKRTLKTELPDFIKELTSDFLLCRLFGKV